MTPATYGDGFVVEIRDGAAWATIDRPEVRNAITPSMLEALPALIDDAVAAGCTSIVFRGAGGASFCSGFDLRKLASLDPQEVDATMTRSYEALAGAAIPTIACIEGWCIGGGLELALCCDLRVCSPRSNFQIPAGKLGITYPPHGLRRIVDVVGPAAARRVVILSERIPAAEAARLGLTHEVAEDAAATAAHWAAEIAASSGPAVNAMRRTLAQLRLTID